MEHGREGGWSLRKEKGRSRGKQTGSDEQIDGPSERQAKVLMAWVLEEGVKTEGSSSFLLNSSSLEELVASVLGDGQEVPS